MAESATLRCFGDLWVCEFGASWVVEFRAVGFQASVSVRECSLELGEPVWLEVSGAWVLRVLNPKGPSTSIVCTFGAQIATK